VFRVKGFYLHLHQQQDALPLPERQKHYGLDSEKLGERANGCQLLVRHFVKKDQAVHRPPLGAECRTGSLEVRVEGQWLRIKDLGYRV